MCLSLLRHSYSRLYCPLCTHLQIYVLMFIQAIGDVFRDRFGSKAGWAHSVLFAAELSEFRHLLPIAMKEEMAIFSEEKRLQKKIEKETKQRVSQDMETSELCTAAAHVLKGLDFEEELESKEVKVKKRGGDGLKPKKTRIKKE